MLTATISKVITQNGGLILRGKVNLAVHQLTVKQSHGSMTAGSKKKQKSLRTTVNVPAYRYGLQHCVEFILGRKVGCPVVLVLRRHFTAYI